MEANGFIRCRSSLWHIVVFSLLLTRPRSHRNQYLFPIPVSLQAGDVITELESVDDDWMSGELMGKSGIFPKNYVQFLQVS